MHYTDSYQPINYSNSRNPKLRNAKEWFHESWVDLNGRLGDWLVNYNTTWGIGW